MRILRLLLFVVGLFCLAGIVVCVVRSDYRGFGSGMATTILIWAGYIVVTYLSKRDTSALRKGARGAGPKCMNCGKKVEGRDSLMASQSYAIQAGLTQKAKDMENDQGYLCQSCGRLYCRACLAGCISNPQAGAACPSCGGFFGYLL
jgi:DNA-directed RNA polymerase subunit RPC12/RpoP